VTAAAGRDEAAARPHSLQRRLLMMVLTLVAVVWLASAVTTWIDVRHELDELLDGHLAQAAAVLVVQQAPRAGDDDSEHEREREHGVDAPSLHRYAPKVAFQVFHEGRLTLRSANAPARPLLQAAASRPNGFATVQIDGRSWRVFATQGAERDVQVFVGERLDSRTAILWAALRSMFWPTLAALPLLALAIAWAVRRGTAPLRQLGQQLAARSPQSLQPVAMAEAPAEMAPLLDALNALFERIAALLDAERRFTADAAHELRTPIAAIRAQAQVALGAADDDAARRHALHATLTGCDRATRLVEQLLTLSRLEAEGAPLQAAVALAALARQVVAEVAPQALAKGQDIAVDASAACAVRGDATLLAVLLRNLVDNAVRYSPAGAAIRLGVTTNDGRVRLTVEDSGPGLADADRQRLGERFFRVVGSGQSGSGLGWSIVRRIAAAHGAEVQVDRSGTLGGLAIAIEFDGSG
jgi:two-component system, OmpR family, sensor histidine kinase QseC